MDHLHPDGRANRVSSSSQSNRQAILLDLIRIVGDVRTTNIILRTTADRNRGRAVFQNCTTVTVLVIRLRTSTAYAIELVDDVGDVSGCGTPAGGLASNAILGVYGWKYGGEREEDDLFGVHLLVAL